MKYQARIGLASLALAAAATTACKQEETKLDRLIAAASATPPPPQEKPFVFPAASGLPPGQIIPVVNRAVQQFAPGQENRIDEWIRGVSVPVVLLGPSEKFVSEVGPLTFRYREKQLESSFPAKFPATAKFFVDSSISCIDASGNVLEKTDWEQPSKARRGERVELPVPGTLVEHCLTAGGVKLGLAVLASPCAIPFPHQVRCAGEYATCRSACADERSCQKRCENNRLDCLDVCKK
jgi:hypothetical protein